MGVVIRLRPRDGARRRNEPHTPDTGEAKILLFTGVRYERHEEPADLRRPRGRPRGSTNKKAS